MAILHAFMLPAVMDVCPELFRPEQRRGIDMTDSVPSAGITRAETSDGKEVRRVTLSVIETKEPPPPPALERFFSARIQTSPTRTRPVRHCWSVRSRVPRYDGPQEVWWVWAPAVVFEILAARMRVGVHRIIR